MRIKLERAQYWLLGLSTVLMLGALFMVFIYAPVEASMGAVQKVFYFHVSVAWVGFLAFFVVFVCSIVFLLKREQHWDGIAVSAAEIGVVFTSLALISGALWAKPVWGVWWTWEPRLTTALVLWVVYVGYLLVRGYAAERERGARFASVVGIIGFLDVPIVFMSVNWWRTQHPGTIVFETGGLAGPMVLALAVSVAAFTVLFFLLLLSRVALRGAELELERIRGELD